MLDTVAQFCFNIVIEYSILEKFSIIRLYYKDIYNVPVSWDYSIYGMMV